MTLRAAEGHYRSQAELAALVARQVRRYWRRVGPEDVNAWRSLLPAVAATVSAGQFAAARGADEYVTAALAEQGADIAADAAVSPVGFTGMGNGPVPPGDLLDLPRIRVLEAVGQGAAPVAALAAGGAAVQRYAVTLVQDAGRQADSVAGFTRNVGWVRMVNPPCCERCAILAGRVYRSNEGFLRHPNCDCRHIPRAEDAPGSIGTDPRALFESGQVTGLRESETRAIGDGADPAQVVNARRGQSRDKMSTTEGTSRRGVSSRARRGEGLRGNTRATPEGIYRIARDRDDALNLLRQNGYIT